MDLASRYRGAYQAALFTAECVEDAHRLGALDSLLKPWVRREIALCEHSLNHCDSKMDLADAVSGLAAIAPRYARLRRDLFSDAHHLGRPEPPWRKVGPTFAVRAPLQVWRQPPAYALLRRDHGSGTAGTQSWEFTVFARSGDPSEPGTTFTAMLFPDSGIGEGTVQVVKELQNQREWYEQLDYAFLALGRNVGLAGLYDPDRGQHPPPIPPTD
ncbi:hypothetical protein [Embleya sp. NBC_00896]|uniref:hypothetical protein n=1 Tax=Embleya sp. NBC_00896 TaxID=2975961 RepID=UPI002F90BE9C|nr:hypothetical protein OG928_40720 [Embleya sp. NBC_00896]